MTRLNHGRTRRPGALARVVKRLWLMGLTDAEIGERLDPPVCRSAVSRCRREVLRLPPAVSPGERSSAAGRASWLCRMDRPAQPRDALGRFKGNG